MGTNGSGPVVRVIVVDDEPLARAGCRLALEACEDLVVVGEAGDVGAAMAVAVHERPDVVLVHGRPPAVDAMEISRRIRGDGRLDGARVVALVAIDGTDVVFDTLRAGVRGVLSPNTDPDELCRAIRAVAEGGAVLAPGAAGRVITEVARVAPSPRWRERVGELTSRERDVVAAVARGLSNDGIGRRLHMSPATARTHVSRALTKLGLRDRSQLVVLAYESGLVAPGSVAPDTHPVYTGEWAAS